MTSDNMRQRMFRRVLAREVGTGANAPVIADAARAVATDAAVAVLATISELRVWLIGESVATRLLREAWPGDFAGDTTEETVT